MSFLDAIKESLSDRSQKRREEKALIDRMRLEGEVARKQVLEEELKKNFQEIVKAKAKKDAATMSGLQKLRAENRLRNLNNPQTKTGIFSKISEYTQRNIARREENLRKTEENRAKGKENIQSPSRKPFTPTRL
jgi:hypothetical protein